MTQACALIRLNTQPDGRVAVTVSNPTIQADCWIGKPAGTALPTPADFPAHGPNCILSVGADGTLGARLPTRIGGDELADAFPSQGVLQFHYNGSGTVFAFLLEMVS